MSRSSPRAASRADHPRCRVSRPTDNVMYNGNIRIEFTTLAETRHGLLAYNHNDLTIGKSLDEYGEWAEHELSGCLLDKARLRPV